MPNCISHRVAHKALPTLLQPPLSPHLLHHYLSHSRWFFVLVNSKLSPPLFLIRVHCTIMCRFQEHKVMYFGKCAYCFPNNMQSISVILGSFPCPWPWYPVLHSLESSISCHLFVFNNFIFVCVCMRAHTLTCVSMHIHTITWQKRGHYRTEESVKSHDPRVTGSVSCPVWVLGLERQSFVRVASAFNHPAISPAPVCLYFWDKILYLNLVLNLLYSLEFLISCNYVPKAEITGVTTQLTPVSYFLQNIS